MRVVKKKLLQEKKTIFEDIRKYFFDFHHEQASHKLRLHHKTFEQIYTTLSNTIELIKHLQKEKNRYERYCLQTSTLTSNICENHFSIVKSKIQYPTAYSWWYRQNQCSDERSFPSLPNKRKLSEKKKYSAGVIKKKKRKRKNQESNELGMKMMKMAKKEERKKKMYK